MKNLLLKVCLSLLLIPALYGQNDTDVKVRIAATVVDYIEMITLADIDVGTVIPSEDILRLDPRNDQGAGIIKLQGRRNASVQVSFSAQVEMINLVTDQSLTVNYSVSGNGDNDQTASDLLATNPANVQLNHLGEYYLWIGCEFNLSNLVAGQYDGDFVIEVDYN